MSEKSSNGSAAAPRPASARTPTATAEPEPSRQCPNCGSFPETEAACVECGYRFDAPDSVPVWDEQLWEVVVRPDRQYYEMIEPDGLEFPEAPHNRRVALLGDHVRIGRRSTRRGITPEIDLSGTLEDVGVSHRHAVLMRQPTGDWALVDQDSANGTYLNADRDPITPNHRVPLRDGDQIHVGAWTTLTVERAEAGGSRSAEVSTPSKDTRNVARSRLDLEIGLLGPLQVAVAGTVTSITAPKARAVLALLALRIGSAVTTGDLEWALWGDDEPRTADTALRGYISALRHILPAGAIETTPQGYRFTGPKEIVDIHRFERRSVRGRELLASGHPGSAVAEITRALDLWRGDPIPDLADGPAGLSEVTRLRERKAGTEEDLFEGRLQLGDHQGVLPDLSVAVEAEPLRERRWRQLMLALYRDSRQAEALQAFQRFRAILGEEHGVEPSAAIGDLERDIVLDKPELRWTPPGTAGTAGGAPATSG
ncbi:MAG: BTAD domain-containing putative transcriptional regulator [Acidimicrobiales bacterium]